MPYNILLVDDDRDFREEFREAFEEYRFVEAQNGTEALDLLAKPNEIDLVILDVRLPDMRGTRVLTEVKRLAPDLPVVILTGFSSKDVAIEALKGDADDYVEKPVDAQKTAAIIRRLLLETKPAWPGADSGVEDKIIRIKSYVERNYDKMVSLEDAASLVCLSPKYLSRLFRDRTGRGFNEYRLERKIEQSKRLLRETSATVNQIATHIGYQNPESFIRIFKKMSGCTPSEFRQDPSGAGRRRRADALGPSKGKARKSAGRSRPRARK
jgi:two-component system, response regulator YesN